MVARRDQRFHTEKMKVFGFVNKANGLKKIDPRKALDLVKLARKYDSDNKFAIGIGTECLVNLKDYPNALKWALENLKIDANEVSYGLLYLALTFMGKFDEALEAAEKSALLAPQSAVSRDQLRRALLQKRLGVRVENKHLETQLEITGEILFARGCEEVQNGKLEQALESILEACELSPKKEYQNLLFEILALRDEARNKRRR